MSAQQCQVDAVKNPAVLLFLQMADSHFLIAEAGKKQSLRGKD